MTTLLTKTRSLFADAAFRWFVLALLFCVSFLNYLDRTSLSVLQETLIREPALGLDRARYADLVNAFTLCYAATLFFSGWVVDRIGPRVALLMFAGLWSLVTIGCGLAQGFVSLFVFRALLGVAEPGLAPVSIRVATAWAPRNSRGLYMNLCSVGGSVGNIATAAIVVWLTTATGTWRWAFILPGLAGLVIAAVWWFCYRDPEPAAAGAPASTPAAAATPAPATAAPAADSLDLTRLNPTYVEKFPPARAAPPPPRAPPARAPRPPPPPARARIFQAGKKDPVLHHNLFIKVDEYEVTANLPF
jgi:ACS family hexuronate transporter-like MFS transporter